MIATQRSTLHKTYVIVLAKMAQKYVNDKYVLLNDIGLYLHKRSCYIDQLQKLCQIEFQYHKPVRQPHMHQRAQGMQHALFDCLIVVGLQRFAGSFKPFIKMKYPKSVFH